MTKEKARETKRRERTTTTMPRDSLNSYRAKEREAMVKEKEAISGAAQKRLERSLMDGKENGMTHGARAIGAGTSPHPNSHRLA